VDRGLKEIGKEGSDQTFFSSGSDQTLIDVENLLTMFPEGGSIVIELGLGDVTGGQQAAGRGIHCRTAWQPVGDGRRCLPLQLLKVGLVVIRLPAGRRTRHGRPVSIEGSKILFALS
jgi:hypothetical protein